ncbi:hypothetical protein [Streptomyces sp. NPDC001750]|uniref:hypothetical protein n=1 Tax=Streptomyces sp. NPDC001750 TaxID=3364607 RepID=UPI003694B713
MLEPAAPLLGLVRAPGLRLGFLGPSERSEGAAEVLRQCLLHGLEGGEGDRGRRGDRLCFKLARLHQSQELLGGGLDAEVQVRPYVGGDVGGVGQVGRPGRGDQSGLHDHRVGPAPVAARRAQPAGLLEPAVLACQGLAHRVGGGRGRALALRPLLGGRVRQESNRVGIRPLRRIRPFAPEAKELAVRETATRKSVSCNCMSTQSEGGVFFGKNGGDDEGGNEERNEASSGLTMLHQAMLHSSTTLSETLDRGLKDVKSTNTEAHGAVAKELAGMTKALRDTQKLLPLPYSARNPGEDDATADELRQLRELVTTMQLTLADVAQNIASLTPVPVSVTATARRESNGHTTTAAGPARAVRSLLDGVPEQRSDSDTGGTPSSGEGPVPAGDAGTVGGPAAGTGTAVETGPDEEGGERAGLEAEAPLTREQVAEAVREVLAEEAEASLSRNQEMVDAVRGVLVREVAPLVAAQPRIADDAASAAAELNEKIAALHAEVTGFVERFPSARQCEGTEGQEQPVADPEHSRVLTQAAGISSAVLVCHRDLWELLSGWAGGHPHFRMPPQIADQGENRIAADISGRSLIAVLISLSRLRHTATEGDGDRELAEAVYQRISNSLAALSPDDGPLVTIALDDRTPHTGDISDS